MSNLVQYIIKIAQKISKYQFNIFDKYFKHLRLFVYELQKKNKMLIWLNRY